MTEETNVASPVKGHHQEYVHAKVLGYKTKTLRNGYHQKRGRRSRRKNS